MAVTSLKVVMPLTVPFSILRCVPTNSVFEIYHLMTPVYVSVIYLFIFLHSFPSETSPEHFNRVFSTCAVRKTKTLGTEWMLVVDWLIFGHGVFPAVKSNQVENAPCDVTREILLNIIHTHQIKIRQKKLRNLFNPSAIFFVTKIPCFCHHVESYQPSIFIISTKQNRSQFSWTVPSYRFCIKPTVAVMAQRGVSLNVTKLLRKEQNYFFLYLSSNWFSDNKHKLIFIEYQTTPIPHIKKATNCP